MKAEYSLFYIIYWIPKWSTNCQITFASTSWSRNHCTHPALLRPIDPLQQQRALALLLRILRSKPYRASRWIRWLDHRQNDAHVNVPFFFLMKWRTLKAQTPFENTQAIWAWADTTWRKSPILGGRSECSDTVAWKLICIWTLDVVNECKWRIQGKWGLCWEHFQLSHSRALSWAVFLFWQVKKQMSPASTSRIWFIKWQADVGGVRAHHVSCRRSPAGDLLRKLLRPKRMLQIYRPNRWDQQIFQFCGHPGWQEPNNSLWNFFMMSGYVWICF